MSEKPNTLSIYIPVVSFRTLNNRRTDSILAKFTDYRQTLICPSLWVKRQKHLAFTYKLFRSRGVYFSSVMVPWLLLMINVGNACICIYKYREWETQEERDKYRENAMYLWKFIQQLKLIKVCRRSRRFAQMLSGRLLSDVLTLPDAKYVFNYK